MSGNRKAYSYHTFFFPFLWNDNGGRITRKDFVQCLSKNWIVDKVTPVKLSESELHEQYNQFHYFNTAARNAIYGNGEKDAVTWNYRYDITLLAQSGNVGNENSVKYVIEKKRRIVELPINSIRLKLFNTGIGILIFEMENYQYPHPEDIAWINDYGRRIYMPFSRVDGWSVCADSISLQCGGTVISSGKLIETPDSFDSTRLAAPILYLLQNGLYSVTANKKQQDKYTFFIEPIIDDRMFVACYYVNKSFADYVAEWGNSQYSYLQDAEIKKADDPENRASMLYRMIFIGGAFTTCHSRPMLKRLLEKHVYDRWVERGTITGITECSMISITSNDDKSLARNFQTEYVEMIILALAQRASLLGFERMISDNALHGTPDIMAIQKSYIFFQSQLLLKEVTPQQQGIELYRMLMDNMFISEQTAEIQNQIGALFTQKTSHDEARENKILFVLAMLGVFEVVDYVLTWLCPAIHNLLKLGISFVIIIAIGISIHIGKNRRK